MRKAYGSALALLFAIAAPALAQQEQSETKPPRVLSVAGTGTVQRQPDRAVLMLAVESRAGSAQDAARANATKMDAIFSSLKRAGIVPPHVATVSYALQPEYRQPDPRVEPAGTPKIAGYMALNTVRVEVDSLKQVGSIIDATIAAGANRIDNLSFELRDPQAARLEALRLAVQNARAQADVLASATGQKLGPPQSINTSGGYIPPRPMYRVADAAMIAGEAAPTPVEAGALSITVNVNITYLLEDR